MRFLAVLLFALIYQTSMAKSVRYTGYIGNKEITLYMDFDVKKCNGYYYYNIRPSKKIFFDFIILKTSSIDSKGKPLVRKDWQFKEKSTKRFFYGTVNNSKKIVEGEYDPFGRKTKFILYIK